MAVNLPPVSSSAPDTPKSDSKTESKLSTAPSTVSSVASLPSKSGSVAVPEKKQAKAKVAAEAPIQKPTLNKRRRDRNSKPKRKKRDTALCVGYYIDALDKKMMWGEARIIQCNLKSQKIKVHFVGWSSNHDRWTDVMSIMAHGRYAPRTKDSTVKSWDGDMYLFEDMLGTIDKAAFPPAPIPNENGKRVALSPTLAKETSDKMTKGHSASRPADHTARYVLKRKADGGSSSDTTILKRIAATKKVIESNGPRREHDQRSKHAVAVVKVKAKAKGNAKEKQKLPRSSMRQKGEEKKQSTTAKARQSAKNGVISADDLPLFRNLELDDGTVMDFAAQREKARMERETMRSFLDKCASIWKDQQSALSVE
ncbi:unnamed protein product [Peronospora farinosa]|uniref:PWWP domain-containing protein n=1 Tax=Peronospora farinosa TaxID=134698 RepID=A0AAV0U1T5_9STRA|nr:unnamed protein product [Peronospora farinosa]CAI5730865.1 unnamed protein product [Peronospora farinosa]